ncbi:MAG: hypothetical protein P8Y23_09730 [Candidatus Lokiarchaeota archaeon]
MSIPEKSSQLLKIKRGFNTVKIHNLFVFNRAGICIYGLNFSQIYTFEQEQLISSYFTALMSFTKELIGDRIKTVEMGGGIKLVVFEKGSLFYCILCASFENVILLEEIIAKIHTIFIEYIRKNDVKIDIEYIYDENLNFLVEDIIRETLNKEFDPRKEEAIIEYFEDIQNYDEIHGCILLTDRGNLIYSSLRDIELKKFLKQVDFRVKICNNSILKLFYTSRDKELILSEYINNLYFVILIFQAKTKFGVAEFYLQKIVSKIITILTE